MVKSKFILPLNEKKLAENKNIDNRVPKIKELLMYFSLKFFVLGIMCILILWKLMIELIISGNKDRENHSILWRLFA